MMILRQGDVLVMSTDEIPAEAKPVERDGGDVILAYGKVTGHAHRCSDPGVCLLSQGTAGDRYLTVAGEAFLTHEEHATIPLAPGNYVVRIQREYAWEQEASRAVAD
jgi:hypothetical protein